MNTNRIQSFVAKWTAEHENAEPPVHEVPTDEALARCFAECTLPPKSSEYPAIRAAIKLAQSIANLARAINMDPAIVRQYKAHRAEHPYAGARTCLSWAKSVTNKVDRPEGFNARGDSFVVDGFDIEISYEYDDAPDFSYLGEFTDSWEPDAIRNPEAWTSRGNRNPSYLAYFVPAISEQEHFDGLRKMGIGRADAREMARKYVRQDMDNARDFTSYVIKVTASKEDVELGTAYLGGIDDENYVEDAVIEHDMIGEAITEAREKLAKLTTTEV